MIVMYLASLKSIQKIYTEFGSFLQTHEILYILFSFLAGVGIKLFLDRMYVTHQKRLNLLGTKEFPSLVTSIVMCLVLLNIFQMGFELPEFEALKGSIESLTLTMLGVCSVIFQQYGFNKLSEKKIIRIFLINVGTLLFLISIFVEPILLKTLLIYFLIVFSLLVFGLPMEKNIEKSQKEKIEIEQLKTLEDFKQWFKDDSIIESIEQLEPDLKIHTQRISDNLLRKHSSGDESNLAQHIALCGPFGCGKSSVIKCIANNLLNDESVAKWIHSDISTWGAENAAHMILNNVVDDINEHIEMCSFRALPQHYLAAMKESGGTFKIITAFLSKHIDIEKEFLRLNGFLKANNYQLLITLQDVDRGEHSSNEVRLNQVASLLDRLKDSVLTNINFIIAIRSDSQEYVEVISKAADYVEVIGKPSIRNLTYVWSKLCKQELFDKKRVLISEGQFDNFDSYIKRHGSKYHLDLYKLPMVLEGLVVSIRQLKRIMRRVDKCWSEERLLGEVDFESLVYCTTLREVNSSLFADFTNQYKWILFGKSLPRATLEDGSQLSLDQQITKLIERHVSNEYVIHNFKGLFQAMLNLNDSIDSELNTNRIQSLQTNEQHLGVRLDYINYLERILLECVSEQEISDQHAYKAFKEQEAYELGQLLCRDPRWQEAFIRFGKSIILRCGAEKSKSLIFSMLEHYKGDSTYFFEGSSVRDLIRFVAIEGHLEEILYAMVVNPFTSKHLVELIEYFEQKVWYSITPNHLYEESLNNMSSEEINTIKKTTDNLFQGIDLNKFLELFKDKLEEDSFHRCLKILVLSELRSQSDNTPEQLFLTLINLLPSDNTKRLSYLFDFFVIEDRADHFIVKNFREDSSLIEKMNIKGLEQDRSINKDKLDKLKQKLESLIKPED